MAVKDKITCSTCKHACVKKPAGESGWKPCECGNPQSEYYNALLNISANGGRQSRITWTGCEHWERGDDHDG